MNNRISGESSSTTAHTARDCAHDEKRRYKRFNIYLPFTFSSLDGNGDIIRGKGITINISDGGAFFLCGDRRLSPGMKLILSFPPSGYSIARLKGSIPAVVLRVDRFPDIDPGRNGECGIAIRFDNSRRFLRPLS